MYKAVETLFLLTGLVFNRIMETILIHACNVYESGVHTGLRRNQTIKMALKFSLVIYKAYLKTTGAATKVLYNKYKTK